MLDPNAALERLDHILSLAKAAGADAADAVYVGDAATHVHIRLGALEDVGRSEGEEIGLRLFHGSRSASVASSDLSSHALQEAVARAMAMARQAPEDPWAGLAPPEMLHSGPLPDLDIYDAQDVSADMLRARAAAVEEAARAVAGITNSEGGSAAHGHASVALATSTGFRGAYRGSSHSLSASVIAGQGADMQRDYAYHSTRHLADLESAAAVGTRAGRRAVARLHPRKLTTGQMSVVFDPRLGGSLVGHMLGAITGASIARKTSFLLDYLDKPVFAPGITIIDDPHRARGLRSKAYDGEGLPTQRRALIDKGILTTWLMDSASARQLGMKPTGHATRGTNGPPGAGASNVHMEAGLHTPAELMADIKTGFYVTELIGMGVNGVTGDYSRGAAGFLIENGQIGPAVAEVTIAGNLKEMFAHMACANDLDFRYAVNVPTLRIDGMTVAGA